MGKGMAIVIVGGLSYATLMTLFIVPVMYDLFYRKDVYKRQTLGCQIHLSFFSVPSGSRATVSPSWMFWAVRASSG